MLLVADEILILLSLLGLLGRDITRFHASVSKQHAASLFRTEQWTLPQIGWCIAIIPHSVTVILTWVSVCSIIFCFVFQQWNIN